jgi:hypothetical protein
MNTIEYKGQKIEIQSGNIWVGKEQTPSFCCFVKTIPDRAFYTESAAIAEAKRLIDAQEAQ